MIVQSGKFWVLVRAVADFVANEGSGRLPLSGSVPDMDADTANYIRLQTMYGHKHGVLIAYHLSLDTAKRRLPTMRRLRSAFIRWFAQLIAVRFLI